MFKNAYYFRQHMYTLVPRHVREDFKWMADIGTKAVSIAVLEQDLFASKWNLDILCAEADKARLQVFAVPSRWGGVVAGAPKVPSYFTSTHPDTWIMDDNNEPVYRKYWGPMSRTNNTETVQFFNESLNKLLTQWPIRGVIWDEPKTLELEPLQVVCHFFDQVGQYAKSLRPELALTMFLFSNMKQEIVSQCAQIEHLDFFGCDGRPWRLEDGGQLEIEGKVLLGQAERFIAEAKANKKKSMFLIENHNMPNPADLELMERRLPEVLALQPDQLIYYYYPRNVCDPDKQMEMLRKYLSSC